MEFKKNSKTTQASLQDTQLSVFVEKYVQMEPEIQAKLMSYLTTMISEMVNGQSSEKKTKRAKVTFSYPGRGEPNNGNPALMAILDLIPKRKLKVKENEYTQQRAIWLCEDYTVTWESEKSKTILAAAFEKLASISK